MERRFHLFSRILLGSLIISGCLFSSCNTYDKVSEERSRLERAKAVYLLDTTVRDAVTINYENGNASLEMKMYFKETEFEVEFDNHGRMDTSKIDVNDPNLIRSTPNSASRSGEPSVPPSDKDLKKSMVTVLRYYQDAQRLFYEEKYKESLTEIDKSLEIMPTADAYAFKGSILYTIGQVEQAKIYWQKAKALDKNFVIPTIKTR
jgi:tetratricopeptide (TPR) repeat protein